MKTIELIQALEKLGQAYTGKDKAKPAEPILKTIAFLKKRKETTLDEIILAITSQKSRDRSFGKPVELSAVAKQYIDRLNNSDLSQQDFERTLEDVKTLQKAPLVQVARGYSFKSNIDTKGKALTAIREEFFRRARERDKARREEKSFLM
jgi:hypothetical protein